MSLTERMRENRRVLAEITEAHQSILATQREARELLLTTRRAVLLYAFFAGSLAGATAALIVLTLLR